MMLFPNNSVVAILPSTIDLEELMLIILGISLKISVYYSTDALLILTINKDRTIHLSRLLSGCVTHIDCMNFKDYKNQISNCQNFSKAWVNSLLDKMDSDYRQDLADCNKVVNVGKIFKPIEIKKYDIITSIVHNSPHPCLIFKIDSDFVYAISFTTTQHCRVVYEIKESRFFNGSFVTNTIVKLTKEEALKSFVGVFDNKKEANHIISLVKDFYKNLFNLK